MIVDRHQWRSGLKVVMVKTQLVVAVVAPRIQITNGGECYTVVLAASNLSDLVSQEVHYRLGSVREV